MARHIFTYPLQTLISVQFNKVVFGHMYKDSNNKVWRSVHTVQYNMYIGSIQMVLILGQHLSPLTGLSIQLLSEGLHRLTAVNVEFDRERERHTSEAADSEINRYDMLK